MVDYSMSKMSEQREISVLRKAAAEHKRPCMYHVIVLNDDYTPMDFVVTVLKQFFNKTHDEAIKLMLKVHYKGQASCGVYTREVAETKVLQVTDSARKNKHPLKCVMKKD